MTGFKHYPNETKLISWHVRPFPEELKNYMVAAAKRQGKTTPVLMEEILAEWRSLQQQKEQEGRA